MWSIVGITEQGTLSISALSRKLWHLLRKVEKYPVGNANKIRRVPLGVKPDICSLDWNRLLKNGQTTGKQMDDTKSRYTSIDTWWGIWEQTIQESGRSVTIRELFYDRLIQLRRTRGIASINDTQFYDWMVPTLCSIAAQTWEMNLLGIKALILATQTMTFHLKARFGQ